MKYDHGPKKKNIHKTTTSTTDIHTITITSSCCDLHNGHSSSTHAFSAVRRIESMPTPATAF
jgi:hypothetical protein